MPPNCLDQNLDDKETPQLRGQSAVPPYEPPRLIRVGRLHNLVAGGAGSTSEMEDPFTFKHVGEPG